MISRRDTIFALFSGLFPVLAFPPLNMYPVAYFAFVPLLISLRGKGLRAAFSLGLITGFVYFLGTVYWVSHSMRVYGHVPLPATLFAVVLLCGYLALYAGVFALLFAYLSPLRRFPAAVTAPMLWVSLEFARTYALTGFPWSVLGYSQYSFLTVIQIADITGVYGVSFLLMAVNGMLFDLVGYKSHHAGEPPPPAGRLIAGTVFTFLLVALVVVYGVTKLGKGESGPQVRASVIQGNIPQDRKWDRAFQNDVIERYETLSVEARAGHPDLIIWPESALPFIFGYQKDLTEKIIDFEKQLGTYLLFGSVTGSGGSMLANSAVLLSPEGDVLSKYDKIHLVPFGEYVPLRQFLPFIDKLVVAVGDFEPGREYVVMDTSFGKIGNLICYEIIFPGLVRAFVHRGANVLVTITNDAWFGRTSAPYQHFSMAVFRAVENRVPVIRAANTGISGFIDPEGRILKKSGIFVEATLTESVPLGRGQSVYTKAGDVFAWLCAACSLVLLIGVLLVRGRTMTMEKV